jgi:hypothetical protein
VELATIVNECGGRAEMVTEDSGLRGFGRMPEFCVGGPIANPRTAAHLRSLLPGVHFEPPRSASDYLTITVGGVSYRREVGTAEYAVLAKTHLPGTGHPLFLLTGQTARTNLAAARLLRSRYRSLLRSYRASGRFCLVLRVVEPETYGPDLVEVAADATDAAFCRPAPPVPGQPVAAGTGSDPDDHATASADPA